MNYIVYDKGSGEILIWGTADKRTFALSIDDSHDIIEDIGNPNEHYVCNKKVVKYTNEELINKASVESGFKWDVLTKTPIQVASNNDIFNMKSSAVRSKRDLLLASTDWTQTPDQLEERKIIYKEYRQALRDITEQNGFPFNVVWPVKPK